jgi:hypothetical protein
MRPVSTVTAPTSTAPTSTAPTSTASRLRAVTRAEPDAGMATAEYAVATVAACGFGGILYKVITSPEILGLLTGLIGKAFNLAF